MSKLETTPAKKDGEGIPPVPVTSWIVIEPGGRRKWIYAATFEDQAQWLTPKIPNL